jgi:NADPH:quinone reductase-like Zn-dependent oxidoreductase
MTDLDHASPSAEPGVAAQPTHAAPRPPGPLPTTMRAAVHERYGSPEQVVTVKTVPVPEVGPDDVLVRVAAASVNALDWHYVTGLPMFARPTLGLRRPKRQVPGADVAGVVEAVGSAVTR